jgi:hypothetical protein
MPYFIFLHDCDEFQINVETFYRQLRARWPKVDFENQMPDDFADALSWWASSGELRAWGGLTRDLRGVWLEDAPEPFAAFAVWFAGIMPPTCKLSLFHDDDGREIELLRGTSEAQLLAALQRK